MIRFRNIEVYSWKKKKEEEKFNRSFQNGFILHNSDELANELQSSAAGVRGIMRARENRLRI